MIIIRPATLKDVDGIIHVCTEGHRVTYEDLLPQDFVETIIVTHFNSERIQDELIEVEDAWNGWIVAVEEDRVVGAGAGSFNEDGEAEVSVLYLDPTRKRAGIGSKLLAEITKVHKRQGATEQWVSVAKGNQMGIPFYEAMGFQLVEEYEEHHFMDESPDSHTVLRYKRGI